MGHNNLGDLGKTYRWRKVIDILYSSEDVSDVALASLDAIQSRLRLVSSDPSFVATLTNILRFVECARSGDFTRALRDSGFSVQDSATVFEVTHSLIEKIDRDLSAITTRSELSEIAQNSFAETLTEHVSRDTTTLFQATASDVQGSIKKFLKGENFKKLMHQFYSTFTQRYLAYHLSRELPRHVGTGRRFENVEDHSEFREAFNLFVSQTVRITDEFTPQWFAKTEWGGELNQKSVSGYAHIAFKKIADEFRRGGDVPK